MQNSDKVVKDIDMNVWKYIYIHFFKIRRKIIGKDGADEYAAMLFVALIDCLFYWGIVTFMDGFTGYHLLPKHEILHTFLFLGGAIIIERIHNQTMCKEKAFERIKKEVEEEPRKILWSILSVLYIISAVAFFALSLYLEVNKKLPILISF